MLTALCVAMGVLAATPSTNSEPPRLMLDQAVRTRLLNTWQLDPAWSEIDILSQTLPAVTVQSNHVNVATKALAAPENQVAVRVTYPDSLGQLVTRLIQVKVSRYAEALVARVPLNRAARLSPHEVILARVRLGGGQSALLDSLTQIDGKQLRRAVGAGQPITFDMLEAIPDLEPGRAVTITCGGSAFRVTTEGTALQKGSAGDLVRVRNNSSGKVLIARVVDATSVALEVLP